MTLLYAVTAGEPEWDAFEGRHWLRALRRTPESPADEAKRQSMAQWRDAYLRWGRDTMGFGLYLFQA